MPMLLLFAVVTERRGRVISAPVLYSEVPSSYLGSESGYPD